MISDVVLNGLNVKLRAEETHTLILYQPLQDVKTVVGTDRLGKLTEGVHGAHNPKVNGLP